jgi:S1-C subfamily serine protease
MNELMRQSEQVADIIEAAAASVVQVQGRRRPASGVVYRDGFVLTTTRAIRSEEGLRIRGHDQRELPAEMAGWDPATGLVLLKADGLDARPPTAAGNAARVGHAVIALARSWTNAVTATTGIVSVIGGPLATGRGRAIDRVLRVSAPMHGGFAGGAVLDAAGALVGVATATEIRGLGVVSPADIAWKTAAALVEHGAAGHGFLGVAGQAVRLPDRQGEADAPRTGVVVVGVSEGSPADAGGILVGDVLVSFDGHRVESPMDLLELLLGDRVGRAVVVRVLRGGVARDVQVTVGRRPAR